MNLESDLHNYQEKAAALDYILKENGSMKEELHQLRKQIQHWKNSTNDANAMLSHIGKQGKNRYADQFYDPALKRIVSTLYKENKILVNKLKELLTSDDPSVKAKHNIAEYVKSNAELNESVQKLKAELEQKFKENRRLHMAIENMNKSGQSEYAKRLESIENLSNKCSQLQTDNRNLRASLFLQNDTMLYLKKVVDSQRKELVEIFARCYAENGQAFLDEMKSLDTKGIPEFLLEPLKKEFGTNTDEVPIDSIARLKIEDASDGRLDSGYASYNEELRLLTTSLRNSEQENERKDRLIDELNLKIQKMNETFEEKDKEHSQLLTAVLDNVSRPTSTDDVYLRNENDDLKRQVENAKADALSWSMALNGKDEEAKHFRRERDEARKERDSLQQKLNNLYEAMQDSLNQKQRQPPQQSYFQQLPPHVPVREPFASSHHWTRLPFRPEVVVADGPISRDYPVTRPKRQSSEPAGSSQPKAEFSMSPKRKSPIEASVDGDQFWKSHVENVLQCEYCGEKYPCSILSDHLRNCDKKYD